VRTKPASPPAPSLWRSILMLKPCAHGKIS
jgi:hypothetical protein